jgi:hypothetical protein
VDKITFVGVTQIKITRLFIQGSLATYDMNIGRDVDITNSKLAYKYNYSRTKKCNIIRNIIYQTGIPFRPKGPHYFTHVQCCFLLSSPHLTEQHLDSDTPGQLWFKSGTFLVERSQKQRSLCDGILRKIFVYKIKCPTS